MKVEHKTLMAGIAVLVTAGIASAAVLSSYGVIKGTADVERSLNITNVSLDNDNNITSVTIENNLDSQIDLDANNVLLETDVGDSYSFSSGEKIDAEKEDTFNISKMDWKSELYLEIDGNRVQTYEVNN